MRFMARLLPANVEAILAAFARAYVAAACPNVVLHTDWLVVLTEFNLAVLWYHYFAFPFAFCFALRSLEVIVFDNGLWSRW